MAPLYRSLRNSAPLSKAKGEIKPILDSGRDSVSRGFVGGKEEPLGRFGIKSIKVVFKEFNYGLPLNKFKAAATEFPKVPTENRQDDLADHLSDGVSDKGKAVASVAKGEVNLLVALIEKSAQLTKLYAEATK